MARTSASRSFRYGHRVFRSIAVLTFRRPKSRTGLDVAATRIKTLMQIETLLQTDDLDALLPSGQAAEHAGSNGSGPGTGAGGASAEMVLRLAFRDRYDALLRAAGFEEPAEVEVAAPHPRDARGVLASPAGAAQASVDVVVCVHNALEDVRRCLWSLSRKATPPVPADRRRRRQRRRDDGLPGGSGGSRIPSVDPDPQRLARRTATRSPRTSGCGPRAATTSCFSTATPSSPPAGSSGSSPAASRTSGSGSSAPSPTPRATSRCPVYARAAPGRPTRCRPG